MAVAGGKGTFTTYVRRPSEAVEFCTTASEGRRTISVNAIGERYNESRDRLGIRERCYFG